jgi:hypothetical protein
MKIKYFMKYAVAAFMLIIADVSAGAETTSSKDEMVSVLMSIQEAGCASMATQSDSLLKECDKRMKECKSKVVDRLFETLTDKEFNELWVKFGTCMALGDEYSNEKGDEAFKKFKVAIIAEYKIDDVLSISLKLYRSHPFLAEYDRELVLLKNGKEIIKQELFPDTGGYNSTNLYRCNGNKYLVKGYFDSWLVDVNGSSIIEEECKNGKKEFIGAFHDVESRLWRFFPANERKEEILGAQGG